MHFVVSLAGLIFDIKFFEVHQTAILAFSNHKQEYGGPLKEISALWVM